LKPRIGTDLHGFFMVWVGYGFLMW